jgi:hypothetical protein
MVLDITLQINLSPGDVAYAALTVPALIRQHAGVKAVLLIVDTCKPGKTKLVDPEMRFPEPAFSSRVQQIVGIAKDIQKKTPNSQLYVLRPNDPLLKKLGDVYLGGWYYNTHDYGGCANMAYWAGFELPETRYVLHFDGDMLLYQKPGYNWMSEAIHLMEQHTSAVAATPRYNTPFKDAELIPSFQHGVPYFTAKDCWLDTFFSTRCLLIDKSRLRTYLPLMRGRILWETLAVKYLNRGYPRSPEIIMYRRIGSRGGHRLILKNFNSWLMHPHSKPKEYIEHFPTILSLIHQGIFPENHTEENLEMESWIKLAKSYE